jgi:hypothetical protein
MPISSQKCSVSIDSCQVLRFVQKGGTCKHSIMKPDSASVGDHASSKMFVAEINNTSQIVRPNASVSAGDLQNRIQGWHIVPQVKSKQSRCVDEHSTLQQVDIAGRTFRSHRH